jgi:hypothetical protein
MGKPRSSFDNHPLRRRLAAVRRRLRLVVTLRGFGWVLAIVLLAGLAAGGLDWAWHLPALVRAVILVGTLAAAGVVAYRALLQPLCTRMDDLTLALRIEERYPSTSTASSTRAAFAPPAPPVWPPSLPPASSSGSSPASPPPPWPAWPTPSGPMTGPGPPGSTSTSTATASAATRPSSWAARSTASFPRRPRSSIASTAPHPSSTSAASKRTRTARPAASSPSSGPTGSSVPSSSVSRPTTPRPTSSASRSPRRRAWPTSTASPRPRSA